MHTCLKIYLYRLEVGYISLLIGSHDIKLLPVTY